MSRAAVASAIFLALAALLPAARADDVYLRTDKDKPAYTGTIKQESPLGIKLKTAKAELDIPADDIRDILYTIEPTAVMVNQYRPGTKAEQAALVATDKMVRAKLLKEALQFYTQTLKMMKADQPSAQRHLEYKLALLRWQMAQESGQQDAVNQATAGLADFRKKNPDAWQTGQCLKMLALLYQQRKQWPEAEDTLKELAQSSGAGEYRLDAELGVFDALTQQGRYADAQAGLQALAAKQPKGSVANLRARLVLAESLAHAKKFDEARKIAADVLAETKDKILRGRAYNTLGICDVLAGQWREASWNFLWVDLIYNQDKGERARALYYLAIAFEEMGDPDRAREWRSALAATMYQGTRYQAWARQ